MKRAILLLVVLGMANPVFAGKADEIVASAKEACGKEISKTQAVKMIKRLFLTCRAGTSVDIGGCKVSCMKSASGAVVGGN